MPSILDTAIGVVFVFLLFSLIVSAANEILLSFLDKRAEFLKEGLEELLRDSGGAAEPLKIDHILQHGLISALSRGTFDSSASDTNGVPSYIPGKSFVLALLSEVQKKGAGGASVLGPEDGVKLRAAIVSLPNKELKETLLALFDDASGRLDHFKANVENWFNESMDRVSGWYTRYAKQWLLLIGLVLAIVGNVDTIHIAQVLAEPGNEALRTAIVSQATKFAEAHRAPVSTSPPSAPPAPAAAPLSPAPESGDSSTKHVPVARPEAPGSVTPPPATPSPAVTTPPEIAPAGAKPERMEEIHHFKEALAELQSTALPLGWDKDQRTLFQDHFFTVIAGWILTALAASLGAPFWFDTLNRFIDIRSNGRAPEESDPTAPKKPSTGVETYVVTGDSLSMKDTPATRAEQTGVAAQQTAETAPQGKPGDQ